MNTTNLCRRCGGEVVQKPLGRLLLVGPVFLAAGITSACWFNFWILATIGCLTGGYLLVWAAVGKGKWCRGCKRFDGV